MKTFKRVLFYSYTAILLLMMVTSMIIMMVEGCDSMAGLYGMGISMTMTVFFLMLPVPE